MDSCNTSDLLPQNSSPTCINLSNGREKQENKWEKTMKWIRKWFTLLINPKELLRITCPSEGRKCRIYSHKSATPRPDQYRELWFHTQKWSFNWALLMGMTMVSCWGTSGFIDAPGPGFSLGEFLMKQKWLGGGGAMVQLVPAGQSN